jgi:hypothetical protein
MANKTHKCVVSGKKIPAERVEALIMLGIPESRWTCVEHALTSPRQGIYLGEVGTSELLIVDKVYNDSVRSVFRGARKQAEAAIEEADSIDTDQLPYNEKELNYYASDEEVLDSDDKVEIIKRQTT